MESSIQFNFNVKSVFILWMKKKTDFPVILSTLRVHGVG